MWPMVGGISANDDTLVIIRQKPATQLPVDLVVLLHVPGVRIFGP
jgi:hypothetical protein